MRAVLRQHAIVLGQPIGDLAACTHDAQAGMIQTQTLCFEEVHRFLTGLFEGDLHAKRILSLANATLGVIRTASLAVHTIDHGLALARGLLSKQAIPPDALASGKKVDRLLYNPGVDTDAALRHWVPFVVGPRTSITVAMDWTEFDADGQAALMLSLLTRHTRSHLAKAMFFRPSRRGPRRPRQDRCPTRARSSATSGRSCAVLAENGRVAGTGHLAAPAGPTAPGCARCQPFKASLTALAGAKASFRLAARVMASPVAGLRPSRSGRS